MDPYLILRQLARPSAWSGSIPTYSGGRFRPWAEETDEIDVTSIAYGLAHTYRYGGQADPGITVAEHSVMVSLIIEKLWPERRDLQLAGLLHDAAEAVLHDLQSPIRSCVVVRLPSGVEMSWDESDAMVTRKMVGRFGITDEMLKSPEVRAADVLSVCLEKRDCRNLVGDWGLPVIPDEIKELKLQFWSPYPTAFDMFMMHFIRLNTP